MRGWAGDGERIRPRVGQVSVRQRLIELEFRNRFRIGGVESAGLIELEEALRRRPSGRQCAMREAQREDVRRPGAPPDEPATD